MPDQRSPCLPSEVIPQPNEPSMDLLHPELLGLDELLRAAWRRLRRRRRLSD